MSNPHPTVTVLHILQLNGPTTYRGACRCGWLGNERYIRDNAHDEASDHARDAGHPLRESLVGAA